MRFVKERDPNRKPSWISPDLEVEGGNLSPMNLTTNMQAGRITLECSQTPFPNTMRLKLDPPLKGARMHQAEIVDNRGRRVEYASGFMEDFGFDAQWKIPDG